MTDTAIPFPTKANQSSPVFRVEDERKIVLGDGGRVLDVIAGACRRLLGLGASPE